MAILDGQQRMTSLYIGLKGSYATKLAHKRWDNPQAYPTKRLYLDLISGPEDRADFKFDFRFLTDEEVEENNNYRDDDGNRVMFWFPVGEILNFEQENEVIKFLIDNELTALPDKDKANHANEAIFKLFSAIHRKETISYYLEESQDLEKVLNIFIRVNSGGTQLSYSDLLLSFATAQWEKMDARDEINNAVDEFNEIGRGFNITKDMLLKSCLVLCDFSDIRFKVENFNKKNMLTIEKKWDDIIFSMRLAIELVASFGFSRENITSNNAFIPIAYYISTIGSPANYVDSGKYKKDRLKIKKWFISSILLRVFSASSSDTILKQIAGVIKREHDEFPYDSIVKKLKSIGVNITFDEDSIWNLLNTRYGSSDAMIVLSVLYPWANLRNNFNIDHVFPKTMFTKNKLKKNGISENKIEFYMENVNYLGNLQLLEEIPNKEKNASFFDKWIEEEYPDEDERRDYMKKNYIPDVDYSFTNFEEFFTARKELILKALKKELM